MREPKGPGKSHRKGISIQALMRMFPSDDAAEAWFIESRWPNGITCARCGSDNVQVHASHPTMPHRCRSCRKFFSVKHGTAMESSKIGYQAWAIAIYIMATGLKGTSSMKLHRDLDISQKSTWHMAHRIRQSFEENPEMFAGPVEADEAYFGGKQRNRHRDERRFDGPGRSGKRVVAGVKDRATNRISARTVETTRRRELQGSSRSAPASQPSTTPTIWRATRAFRTTPRSGTRSASTSGGRPTSTAWNPSGR